MQTMLTIPSIMGYGYVRLEDSVLGLESGIGDSVFISHAHSDHLKPLKKRKLLCSEFTAQIGYGTNKPVKINNVSFHNAGHIPGSLQAAVDTCEGKIVYTGDLKLSSRGILKGAEIIDCDYLIIESTYARSVHMPYEESVTKLRKFLKKQSTKLIGAYRVGKAQEVTAILNEQGITPVVSKEIAEVNIKYPGKLDYVIAGSDECSEIIRDDYTAIMPPNHINRQLAREMSVGFNKKVYTIGITAQPWAVWKYDIVFPISDHADQNELVEYVENADPDMILTTHGQDIYFAELLRKKGFNAIPYSKLKR